MTDARLLPRQPDTHDLIGFSGRSAGQARVLAGALFGLTGPVDTPPGSLVAELVFYPGEECVFMVDPELAHSLFPQGDGLVLNNAALPHGHAAQAAPGTTTLHVVNRAETAVGGVLIGGSPS